MGGNIGTAILALAPPAPDRCHVVEMSSFQIELTPTLEPTVGILLNITPDHLDRHGTMEHYAALKARLVQHAKHPIIGDDDDWCRDIGERLRLANRTLGRHRLGALARRPRLVRGRHRAGRPRAVDGTARRASPTSPASPRCAASTTCRTRSPPALPPCSSASRRREVAAALATFPGLPHRLEEIGRVGRTLFINDSKATNADSAATALAAFDRDIFWILGGKPKQGGITSLASYFPRVAKAYLIGEATEEFAATLEGKVSFERCGTLDRAVAAAARDAAASGAAPTGRAAVAGLRLLRSVPQLRGQGRCLPRAGGGAAGHRAQPAEPELVPTRNSLLPQSTGIGARAARMHRYWP